MYDNSKKILKNIKILKKKLFLEAATKCLSTISAYQKSLEDCGYTIMIFPIKISSTNIRNATFRDLTLEKSENIKDFLEILKAFFLKLCIDHI